MKKQLLLSPLVCLLLWGCGPMDPSARWQVYEPLQAKGGPRLQVLTYVVNKERHTDSVRVVCPDGTQLQIQTALDDPQFWSAFKVGTDGTRTEIPLIRSAEGMSLGGAWWGTVDRHVAESQPSSVQP